MTEFSKVTQADRDAAADLALAMQMDATAYIVRKGKGDADTQPLTQAFARHRIAALSELEAKLRMIVSHATGGAMSDTSLSTNDICVRITQRVNHIYAAGEEKARTVADKLRRGE